MEKLYRKQFPNLYQFFGYFHNLWPEMYPPQKGAPRYCGVLDRFLADEKGGFGWDVLSELDKFISLGIPEEMLREAVCRDLGANIYPPGINMTYQSWLKAVHEYLSKGLRAKTD